MSPAEEHLFSETPPGYLLLDTNFVVATLVAGDPRHEECLSFAGRLQDAGTVIAYSTLLRLEHLNAWRNLLKDGLLPPEPGPQLRLELNVAEDDRSHWLRVADILLGQFLAQFPRTEIRLNQRVVSLAIELVGRFNLQSYDAVHVASAFHAGCTDIASLDKDFRRVEGIDLWNNRLRPRAN
jgi:predicted nucleic acid-binding protein